VPQATLQFHALCEGLAALELRGALPRQEAQGVWREGLGTLVAGFATPPQPRVPAKPRAATRKRAKRS
jgi:hypothetical protein